jgi:hypothetical protein
LPEDAVANLVTATTQMAQTIRVATLCITIVSLPSGRWLLVADSWIKLLGVCAGARRGQWKEGGSHRIAPARRSALMVPSRGFSRTVHLGVVNGPGKHGRRYRGQYPATTILPLDRWMPADHQRLEDLYGDWC